MTFHSLSESTSTNSFLPDSMKSVPTKRMQQEKKQSEDELNMEILMYRYFDKHFENYTEEQKQAHLAKFEPLQMIEALKFVKTSLHLLQLENHVLIRFLEKNDPTLLIGMHRSHKNFSWQGIHDLQRSQHHFESTPESSFLMSSPASSLKRSISKRTSERSVIQYSLNVKAKAEIAEKVNSEVDAIIAQIERNAVRNIKELRVQIEAMRYESQEIINTEINFKLHFLNDDKDILFLYQATEKQFERKLRKFTQNWIKNARALMSKIHLTSTSLQDKCQQYRNDLMVKVDLNSVLSYFDYEKLLIKHKDLFKALEDKRVSMSGLKLIAAKAALAMTEEKNTMNNLENEIRNINDKSEELNQIAVKLEKDANVVDVNNRKSRSLLDKLRSKQIDYSAPSVDAYIEQKEKALLLDKEEKMLKRKIFILNMKLNSITTKTKTVKKRRRTN